MAACCMGWCSGERYGDEPAASVFTVCQALGAVSSLWGRYMTASELALAMTSLVTVTGNDSGIAGQPVNGVEKLGHWGVAVQDKAIVLIRGI